MFVAVISFPPIKAGKDAEFQEWFAASNKTFAHFKGFIGRKLLKPLEGGNYAAIVEFEDQAAFQSMHSSPMHEKAGEQVKPLFDGKPTPKFYEVISG
jgi:heme-degrading monooxygenase HmoA